MVMRSKGYWKWPEEERWEYRWERRAGWEVVGAVSECMRIDEWKLFMRFWDILGPLSFIFCSQDQEPWGSGIPATLLAAS